MVSPNRRGPQLLMSWFYYAQYTFFSTDHLPSRNENINRIVEDELIISSVPTNNFTLTELGTVDLNKIKELEIFI